VAKLVLQQKVHSRLELLALAKSKAQQGDSCLYDFVLSRSQENIVHFAAPNTTYNQGIEFCKDTPIFATAKPPMSFVKGSVIDDRKTEMMNVRWRLFTFKHQCDINCQKTVPSCTHCFATMLLQ